MPDLLEQFQAITEPPRAHHPGADGARPSNRFQRAREIATLGIMTVLAMLVQGYHPGLEDDVFYLAAIRKDLNPALFPHDSDFFQLQFQATIFDELVAWSVRLTHLPLEWVSLLWQFASIFLILWCCLKIVGKCFEEAHARWAAVGLVAALLTIPVSGTGIFLVDQYLHPRALATAAILGAVVAVLESRLVIATLLLIVAASTHVIMASFGVSFCLFLGWNRSGWKPFGWRRPARLQKAVAAFALPTLGLPMGWMFDPVTAAWRQAAATRTFYFVSNWPWYEWLGILAPLLLLWWFHRIARRNKSAVMERLALRLCWFGVFQLALGLAIMLPARLERLRPLEPMRYLHLIYLFLFLLGGGLIGKYVLGRKVYRWALLFAPLCFGMWYAQRQMFPATEHLELPGISSRNEWVKAFEWVRENTPQGSLFALDPRYMELAGEDFHGFRALAARSVLSDSLKDPGMVARVPRLAGRWQAEMKAQSGWRSFGAGDFHRLRMDFGVDWVLLAKGDVAGRGSSGMKCPYRDSLVAVCRVE